MTEHQCIVCPTFRPADQPRVYDRAQVCEGCRTRMREDLTQLPHHYTALPAALQLGTGWGPRVSGTPSRSLGVSLHTLNLLTPAGDPGEVLDLYGDQYGELAPLVVLDQWVSDWIDTRDMAESHPPPPMATLTAWLADRLDWAADHHPAVDEYAREVSAIARTVAGVSSTDHGRGEYVGKCPVLTRDDTPCNTTLRVDPYTDVIQCARCGTNWHRRKGEWLKLRGQQLAATPSTSDVA